MQLTKFFRVVLKAFVFKFVALVVTLGGRLLNLLLSSRDVSGFDEKCVHTM
jgi:hypothetical protein